MDWLVAFSSASPGDGGRHGRPLTRARPGGRRSLLIGDEVGPQAMKAVAPLRLHRPTSAARDGALTVAHAICATCAGDLTMGVTQREGGQR
jgi:hypothetical protein